MKTNILSITSEAALDGVLLGYQSTKDHALKLTYLRADFIRLANGAVRPNHPLYKQNGFDDVYRALNKRAEELGFTILSYGYRKPLNAE